MNTTYRFSKKSHTPGSERRKSLISASVAVQTGRPDLAADELLADRSLGTAGSWLRWVDLAHPPSCTCVNTRFSIPKSIYICFFCRSADWSHWTGIRCTISFGTPTSISINIPKGLNLPRCTLNTKVEQKRKPVVTTLYPWHVYFHSKIIEKIALNILLEPRLHITHFNLLTTRHGLLKGYIYYGVTAITQMVETVLEKLEQGTCHRNRPWF